MLILGISCFYHDSAAALINDKKMIAAAEEERFTRKKHDNSFPKNAVRYCLEQAGVDVKDLDSIVFYEKPILKFERIIQTTIETFPFSAPSFTRMLPDWVSNKLDMRSHIKKKLKYKGEIIFAKHHDSHAATAFLCSPFRDSAVLTVDGVGEWTTTGLYKANNKKITPIKETKFPNSLGLLYSTVTSFLGFKVNNDEYKVMGLSSYGKPAYKNEFERIIDVKDDGSFRLNMKYFDFRTKDRMWGKKFERVFGEPRIPESSLSNRDKNLAATVQTVLEETLLKIANHLYEITKSENLCMSGGVALNCVANSRLREETSFKRIFIQPAATDAGSSLGSALWAYSMKKSRPDYIMKNAYLGPIFTNEQIKSFLQNKGTEYEEISIPELLKRVSGLLSKSKIVGWFQGRMEFGPRALGNRSILADPRDPEMKDIVNKKVKHREPFRPFAGTILWEKAKEYFHINSESPYMLMTFRAKEKAIEHVPAILHVDNTSRLQTIKRNQNPLYYDLIKHFYRITKVPCILNTSFNIRGEPIVCSPEDAYNCFMGTQIDHLVMGNFILSKTSKK